MLSCSRTKPSTNSFGPRRPASSAVDTCGVARPTIASWPTIQTSPASRAETRSSIAVSELAVPFVVGVPLSGVFRSQRVGRWGVTGRERSYSSSISSSVPWAAKFASWSHRSFSACPACPRTHSKVTSCSSTRLNRRSQRSGLSAFPRLPRRQPFDLHLMAQPFVMPSTTYLESVVSITR